MRRAVYAAILAVLVFPSLPSALGPALTMHQLADLPREAHGLSLHIRAVKDTFLLGEPIMIEVFLHNAGADTVKDACKFRPYDGWLTFYAVHSDSEAVRIPQEIHRTGEPPPLLEIPPGRCVGSAMIFGSSGLILPSTVRGPGEYSAQHFQRCGTHRLVATYYRDPAKWSEINRLKVSHIVSNPDTFYVSQPSGWNRTVYEAIGDTLFNPFRTPGTEAWEKDPAFWESLCVWDSTSVYAPWIWAGHARCVFTTSWDARSRSGRGDFEQTVEILNELVERYPGHRFSQEAEFIMATMLCLSGRGSEAMEQSDQLHRKYPENVRAYVTCKPDPKHRAVEWFGLRDDPTVGAGECPDVGETP